MSWEVEFAAEFERWYRGLDQRHPGPDHRCRTGAPRSGTGAWAAAGRFGEEFSVSDEGVARGDYPHPLRLHPRRVAVLLTGGDKQHKWQKWYRTAIPEAGRLYAKHLKTIRDRG